MDISSIDTAFGWLKTEGFVFVLLISIIRSNLYVKSKYDINENKFYGVIIDYKIKDTYISFTLKGKEKILQLAINRTVERVR